MDAHRIDNAAVHVRAGAATHVALLLAGMTLAVSAQQVPDRGFQPAIVNPAYSAGAGPVVCVDEGHHNFHTLDNRFWAFGELLRRDGYQPRPLRTTLHAAALAACRIVVISNAQPSAQSWSEYPYPTPSAFTAAEASALHAWVRGGGSLLLIADHMPLAGAAAALAEPFGVEFTNGFAMEGFASEEERPAAMGKPTFFRRDDDTLRAHAIVRGRSGQEAVARVRTFTGQAFRAPAAEPLLVLPPTFVSLLPRLAWQFGPETPRQPVGGWLQGAVVHVGQGRAAFFGEAAMFSAQLGGAQQTPMGMNAPGAEQNAQFVLNVLHWLSGIL